MAAATNELAPVTDFRAAFRDCMAAALEAAIGAGELPIAGLLELVRETADPKFGDYTATLAMPLAKRLGAKPRDLAEQLITRLNAVASFAALFEPVAGPVGPGFINARVRDDALARGVAAACGDARLGVLPVAHPETIVLDYSSPNVAKPMHVGHIRSTVIGDALARILRFRGHRVITDNHLGDWGTQFSIVWSARWLMPSRKNWPPIPRPQPWRQPIPRRAVRYCSRLPSSMRATQKTVGSGKSSSRPAGVRLTASTAGST
jgi:arginyl-tRNA synthetase